MLAAITLAERIAGGWFLVEPPWVSVPVGVSADNSANAAIVFTRPAHRHKRVSGPGFRMWVTGSIGVLFSLVAPLEALRAGDVSLVTNKETTAESLRDIRSSPHYPQAGTRRASVPLAKRVVNTSHSQ